MNEVELALDSACRRSWPDRIREQWRLFISTPPKHKMLIVLTVFGFAVPVVAYFAFLAHYGVNVIIFDQWSDVALIGKAFSGHLAIGDLWTQHNQNRMLFPNLLVLFLAYTTHLNVRVEEYLSAVLLVGSVALIIVTHRRRSSATPLFWYCPVAILMLSWVQYENTLWGFQVAWYVVLVCLAGTLATLDRDHLTNATLVVAVAIAIIGSCSSVQGLLIWPSSVLLLLYRRRSWRVLVVWGTAAVATTTGYFYHWQSSRLPPYQINPLLHPFFALKLFFFSLGNTAGKPLTISLFPVSPNHPVLGTANVWIVAFGVIVFFCAVFGVVRTGCRGTRERPEPLGVSLILFAVGFDLLTVIGRGLHGYAGVSASRYTTYNMLALVGAYLIVISRPSVDRNEGLHRNSHAESGMRTVSSHRLRVMSAVVVPTISLLIVACVVVQAVGGFYNGLLGGRQDHAVETRAATILHSYPAGNRGRLTPYDIVTGFAKQLIPIAQRDTLSLFDTR